VSLQDLPVSDRPLASMMALGSGPLLGTLAHGEARHRLADTQKQPSQRSATFVMSPLNIPQSARPETTGPGVSQLHPF
jgi:hypothetical protein